MKVFMTGATGTMGMAALRELASRPEHPTFILLARDSKKNRKQLAPYLASDGFEVIWGDLLDPECVSRGIADADLCLHLGGMVSPLADYYPEKAMKVNLGSMRNIIDAVKALPDPSRCRVVYIGSVSQYVPHNIPDHWVDASSSQSPAEYDTYAFTKIEAERMLRESGIPKWVSLRLGSILSSDLLKKGTDPITFHVPLRGVLEWTTDGDCGRLLANLSSTELPEDFWNRAYNIGSGKSFRLTYHEFETKLLKTLGCPPPEKIFEPNWFATGNFHGAFFRDSDLLDSYLHFRGPDDAETHFCKLKKTLPWYFRLAPLTPAFIIKLFMKPIAGKWPFGPLSWIAESDPRKPDTPRKRQAEKMVKAFFGSRDKWTAIPGWQDFELPEVEKDA